MQVRGGFWSNPETVSVCVQEALGSNLAADLAVIFDDFGRLDSPGSCWTAVDDPAPRTPDQEKLAGADEAFEPVGAQTAEQHHARSSALTADNRAQFDCTRLRRLAQMDGHVLDLCAFRITI